MTARGSAAPCTTCARSPTARSARPARCGCCREARPDLADPVVVMNGDLMVDYDARALLAYHAAHGAAVTMGVRSYQHEVPFGVVERGADGHVTAVAEKPTLTLEINAAVYAVEPRGRRPACPQGARVPCRGWSSSASPAT